MRFLCQHLSFNVVLESTANSDIINSFQIVSVSQISCEFAFAFRKQVQTKHWKSYFILEVLLTFRNHLLYFRNSVCSSISKQDSQLFPGRSCSVGNVAAVPKKLVDKESNKLEGHKQRCGASSHSRQSLFQPGGFLDFNRVIHVSV